MIIKASDFDFDEQTIGMASYYFIGPREYVCDEYPEAEHCTLEITTDSSGAWFALSPTIDGVDIEFTEIEVPYSEQIALMRKALTPLEENARKAYEVLSDAFLGGADLESSVEEAIGYLGEVLS